MRRLRLLALAAVIGCAAAPGGEVSSLESQPLPPPMIEATGDGY
jgi:hypothetical protein